MTRTFRDFDQQQKVLTGENSISLIQQETDSLNHCQEQKDEPLWICHKNQQSCQLPFYKVPH